MKNYFDSIAEGLFPSTKLKDSAIAVSDAQRKAITEEQKMYLADLYMSGAEAVRARAASPIFLVRGQETSRNNKTIVIAPASINNWLNENPIPSVSQVNPVSIVNETKSIAQDDFLGFCFSFSNTDKDGAPGKLVITDAASGIITSIKAVEGRLVGACFACSPEQNPVFDEANGLVTEASTDRFYVDKPKGAVTFAATGLTGDIYPIVMVQSIADNFAYFQRRGDIPFTALAQSLVQDVLEINIQ
jgi:hypothetical protein